MDRPAKRQRIDWDDEFISENDYGLARDKDLLEREHQRNILAVRHKLKNRFEDIFLKYERDFSGIGDEVDLETGEVVINNGHLNRMRNERDVDGYSDESSAISDLDSRGEANDNLQPPVRKNHRMSSASLSILQHPPLDPRWAAPEIPGLSYDVASTDESELVQKYRDASLERSVSPEVSIWDMHQEYSRGESGRIRREWTIDELALICRSKNMGEEWDIAKFREMFPDRNIEVIRQLWYRIEKGRDPATYLRNKIRIRKGQVQDHQPVRSTAAEDTDGEDAYETETDELAQPSPVIRAKHVLTTPPQLSKATLPETIKQEPQATVSPATVQHIAGVDAAPASSSPVTNALGWLRRSTDVGTIETQHGRQTPRSGAKGYRFRIACSPKPTTLLYTPSKAQGTPNVNPRHRTPRTTSTPSRNLRRDAEPQTPAESLAAVPSDEGDVLSDVKKERFSKCSPIEVPDSEDPTSSLQSNHSQRRQHTIPDSQELPASSREIVANDDGKTRKQKTPTRSLSSSTSLPSGRREGPVTPAHWARRSQPGVSHAAGDSSFSLLELSSDDERENPSVGISVSASAPKGRKVRSQQNVVASEKRSQCGRDGFSCGRIICLRCA